MTTMKKIRREAMNEEEPHFLSPKKRLKKKVLETLELDGFDCDVISRLVHDFYISEKRIPSISKLLPILQEKLNFKWKRESLRKVLHSIGFHWGKSQNNRKILMERSNIVLKRTISEKSKRISSSKQASYLP